MSAKTAGDRERRCTCTRAVPFDPDTREHDPACPWHGAGELLDAARCLRNAHGNIATAYAQIVGVLDTPGRRKRALRALEHMEALDA